MLLLVLLGTSRTSSAQEQIVVPFNQTWKYEQSDVDLGTTWREPGFDDSGPGWGSGTGPLGFQAGEVLFTSGLTFQTLLNRTTNGIQPRTYYFRTTFVYNGDPGGVILVATNLIDDAAVFYLNGVELARVAFPPAPTDILYTSEGSRAASDVNTYGYDNWTNASPGLVQGVNTYAVEVHQTGAGSSDLVFATQLAAIIPTPLSITAQPTNRIVPENRVVNITVGVSGSSPVFQWYKDSSPIPDATNQTYTIPNSTIGDTGDYFVIATNYLNAVTSQVARLTVVTDITGPVLLNVKGDDTYTKLFLSWNELILIDAAEEEGSYQVLAPDLTPIPVTLATLVNGSNVILTLGARLLEDTVYSVEAGFQVDVAGNATVKVGNPVIDPTSGVVASVRSFVVTRGFTRFQAYLNRTPAEPLATFVTLPEYPDGASFDFYTNVLYWPQTANPNVEQYVMRFTGLFVAPETGIHQFDPAHDDEMRLRVFPGEDPSVAPLGELAAACCTALTGGPTLPVDLVAGQRYYYELLVHEFGGGDYAGISVTLPSGAVSGPTTGIAPQYMAIAADQASAPNAGIAQQPQDQTVQLNHQGTFAVVVTNAGGSGASFQWQINTGAGFSDITGANAASYITPLQTVDNNGDQYRVLVTVPGRGITSSVAAISVVDDTTPPHVASVHGSRNLNAITVFFDEVIDPSAIVEIGNYDLKDSANNPLLLSSPVAAADNRSVTFSTPPQTVGGFYTLHVENVPDAAGNPLAPADVTFQTWVITRGSVLFEAYNTGGGNAVADLVNNPLYPNSPDLVASIPTFDSRNVLPTDAREGYGARISGYVIPPATTDYIFYLRSDDASELWLSTDDDPANKVLIQDETGCCNAFSVNASAPISLTEGQSYYIELLYKEGTGGDFGQVAVKAASDPTNPDLLTPIPGTFLASLTDPVGGTVTNPPPRLVLRRGTSDIVIAWPASDTGFTLETAPTITPAAWTPVSGVTVINGENTVTIPIPPSGNAFYRLRR